MSDLICRKSMARCLTPGMCSPHGGCQPDKTEWQSGYDEGRRMGTKHMYAEVDRLKAENEALRQEVELDDKLIADRDRLLNLFECPDHGQCIPYAMEQVEALRKALTECADSLHAEMLQKFGGQLPDDMHPVTRREYDRDMAEVSGYRAAMGKGEQS